MPILHAHALVARAMAPQRRRRNRLVRFFGFWGSKVFQDIGWEERTSPKWPICVNGNSDLQRIEMLKFVRVHLRLRRKTWLI